MGDDLCLKAYPIFSRIEPISDSLCDSLYNRTLSFSQNPIQNLASALPTSIYRCRPRARIRRKAFSFAKSPFSSSQGKPPEKTSFTLLCIRLASAMKALYSPMNVSCRLMMLYWFSLSEASLTSLPASHLLGSKHGLILRKDMGANCISPNRGTMGSA